MKSTLKSVVQEKSYQFALDIIDLHQVLRFKKREFVMSTQVLKSGTSIGAKNAEEALGLKPTGFSRQNVNCLQRGSRKLNIWYDL